MPSKQQKARAQLVARPGRSNHGGKSRKRATHRERKPDARDYGDRKTAHEQAAKKPCHLHGPEEKHLYYECRTNPKIGAAQENFPVQK